jgi:hypothetical protein
MFYERQHLTALSVLPCEVMALATRVDLAPLLVLLSVLSHTGMGCDSSSVTEDTQLVGAAWLILVLH